MTGFILIAALLALAAAALIVIPLVRPRRDGAPPAAVTAIVCLLVVGAGAAALYPLWSNWSWSKAQDDASPEGRVGQLARRLEREPGDLDGWLMLGRSYTQLGQYPLAAKAYRRADRLAGGRNSEALSGLGEALILGELSDLKGEAGRLFEKALELDPRSIRALFYAAVAAYDRGDLPLARQRFELLLTGNPPAQVRDLIERQLAAMDVQQQQRASAPPEGAATAPKGETTLHLHVSIDPALAGKAGQGAPLFVSVRPVGEGGPPLAAKRLEAHFPQDVELSAGDAMIPGRALRVGQDVEITARVANGGSAAARSGDPVGTVKHRITDGASRIELRIDRLTP